MEDRKDKLISALMETIYGSHSIETTRHIFVNIIGMTTDSRIWRRLAMSWGVTPVMADRFPSMDVMFYFAKQYTVSALGLQSGDNIIMTGGPIDGNRGNTNTIKIEVV